MLVQWILRIGVFGTFLGHGVYALNVRADWIIFLTTVGFTQDMAAKLMPVIGIIDIVIALLALIRPMRFVFIYAFIWALATAMMRPVVGMPIWEFVERSANWAIPLSLVFMLGWPKNFKQLFN
ncbi:hypothetical protein KC799_07510 [candidate division KSB1 bacterium]|nr:hypothetical protein [candidate division KSB1 bacterium]